MTNSLPVWSPDGPASSSRAIGPAPPALRQLGRRPPPRSAPLQCGPGSDRRRLVPRRPLTSPSELESTPTESADLWILPMDGSGDAFPSPTRRSQRARAPSRRTAAGSPSASDETGQSEVYVAPFPGPGPKRQVSRGSGDWSMWTRDGKRLLYVAPDGKMEECRSAAGASASPLVLQLPGGQLRRHRTRRRSFALALDQSGRRPVDLAAHRLARDAAAAVGPRAAPQINR